MTTVKCRLEVSVAVRTWQFLFSRFWRYSQATRLRFRPAAKQKARMHGCQLLDGQPGRIGVQTGLSPDRRRWVPLRKPIPCALAQPSVSRSRT